MNFLEAALEDLRARQTAVVDHIRALEGQALSLLSVCSALAVACVSAAAASTAADSAIPGIAIWALGGAAISFSYGSLFAILVLSSTKMALPAKDAEFWTAALLRTERPAADILAGYIAASAQAVEQNYQLIGELPRKLWHARAGILVAPAAAAASGAAFVAVPWTINRIFVC